MQSIRTCEWDKWPNKKLVLSSNPKSSLTLYALFIYCPVLESTRISSPTFTKEGTVTTAQVSRVASFVPPTKYSNNMILVTGMPTSIRKKGQHKVVSFTTRLYVVTLVATHVVTG